MKQCKNISNHRDNAIHMTQLKTEHLSGIMQVNPNLKIAYIYEDKIESFENLVFEHNDVYLEL